MNARQTLRRRGPAVFAALVALALCGAAIALLSSKHGAAPIESGSFVLDGGVLSSVSGKVTGVVVDPSGKPAAGAEVWLLPHRDFQQPPSCLTEGDGRFEISYKGAFLYAEKVTRFPPYYLLVFARDVNGRTAGAAAVVSEDEPLEVRLIPLVSLEGRVRNRNGDGVGGVRVEVMLSDAEGRYWGEHVAESHTAEDGTFVFAGVPDECFYTLLVEKDGRGAAVKTEIRSNGRHSVPAPEILF